MSKNQTLSTKIVIPLFSIYSYQQQIYKHYIHNIL
jgi:hypothetical protein